MRVAIVVPCHVQPSNAWIDALSREASGKADVIIVDDSGNSIVGLPGSWRKYGYAAQEQFLGEPYKEFATLFHKCSACRVFGHILAYKEGYDVIIGLDSDCIVPFNFVESHVEMLGKEEGCGWENPLGASNLYPRGYPYHMRDWKIVANIGLWENVLDLNGADRKPGDPKHLNANGHKVAPAPVPFSGMNFALLREAVPGFLFIPNFKHGEYNFQRIDDIWGGYIFQYLARKRHEAVIYGKPVVFHDTVVDAESDALEEDAMYEFEEIFVDEVDAAMNLNTMISPKLMDYKDLFTSFVYKFDKSVHFKDALPAMNWWIKVWSKI